MRTMTSIVLGRMLTAAAVSFLAGVILCAASAVGQATGPNAVYNSGAACCTPSNAFIDASTFAKSGSDFCTVINAVLKSTVFASSSGVIDARGVPSVAGVSMTCSASPWGSGSSYLNVPSTILLPATGGGTTPTPIVIPSGWVLPPGTHLIGVGDGDVATSSGATYSGTTIQACKAGQCQSAFAAPGTMISFCNSACSGVSVENLNLDGQGQTGVSGIANAHTV